jgi:glycerate-2-kinase
VSAGGPRAELEACFAAALGAVDAAACVRRAVTARGDSLAIAGAPLPVGARLVVLALGKAAAAMAAELERIAGGRIAAGLAVTAEGHALPLARIGLRLAAHPVPDVRCERAAREALALAAEARPEDVLVVLLSGGASSLCACPAPGLRIEDLARTSAALLAGGTPIDELNAVRKHTSDFAGGRLARAAGCRRIEVLAISDVPGDRIDVIGSGPLAADPTRYADALAAIDRRGLAEAVAPAVLAHLRAGARGEREETPKPGDPALARVRTTLVARNATAVEAALAAGRRAGLRAVRAGSLAGEAREAGRRLAALAAALRADGPLLLVAGGETTVSVRGTGRGGRSQELALAAAVALEGRADCALLAAGTDGRDGPTDAAGAYADGGTLARARARGLDARAALANNDSHGFFCAEGGVFRTGPTRTNVMDLALLRAGA